MTGPVGNNQRQSRNPIFGNRKLKLGTFCTNLSFGCTMSAIDGALEARWPDSLALARLADQLEFEALIPVGRWKGFGGKIDFNGAGFECFTWASAISASTRYPGVLATSHVPTIHPVLAAKQATTIDHVSNGRFALNVVTGWYQPEIEMFGAPLLEHDERYEMAAEWLAIVKKLWTEEREFEFEGKYYRITKGSMRPKPVQRPHPPVMCAGVSKKGREFATKYCDVSFVNLDSHKLEDMRARIESVRKLAREFGREVQVWTNAYIYQGETEKEARRYYEDVVFSKGDWEGVDNLLRIMGLQSQSIAPERLKLLKEHFIAGWGGFPLVGTKEQIVDGLNTLSQAGFDGIVLSWARYIEDMQRFSTDTYPLLQQAGLR
jgi:alkanesulfonate monooxygenase SsuD/methylene tetrahydromethanopterin reductase-like flavin-dependent oxidoreductase (luciferase family)